MDSSTAHCIFIPSNLVKEGNSVTFKGNEVRYFRGTFYLAVFRVLQTRFVLVNKSSLPYTILLTDCTGSGQTSLQLRLFQFCI